MPQVKAQLTLNRTSNLPEDVVVASFWFSRAVGDFVAADFDKLRDEIYQLFNEPAVPATANTVVAAYMSNDLIRTANSQTIDFYDAINFPDPLGSPIASRTVGIEGAGLAATDLPGELAVCTSFHGDLTNVPEVVPGLPAGPAGDTKPRARRRGRLFIGPLNTAALKDEPGDARVADLLRTSLATCTKRMVDDLKAYGVDWCVASRAAGVLSPIKGGFVDNAFDIQRRRGTIASNRTTWLAA